MKEKMQQLPIMQNGVQSVCHKGKNHGKKKLITLEIDREHNAPVLNVTCNKPRIMHISPWSLTNSFYTGEAIKSSYIVMVTGDGSVAPLQRKFSQRRPFG